MKLFLDSTSLEEIQAGVETGLIDGVTTNPSLVLQSGQPQESLIRAICEIVEGPVSVEVTTLEAVDMVQEGRTFSKWAPNVVVKVPLTVEGLKACRSLRAEGIPVNVTLCFSATQALLAAKAGATFISPFIGRLEDMGGDGQLLLEDMDHLLTQGAFEAQILAASIRNPAHVLMAVRAGADVVTLPFSVFQQLYQHPLTDKGLAIFMEAVAKTPTCA
ncbi:MAG: fructose-6-phosphate aldolase [Alphaproteobacteria bacterium]